MHQAFSSRLTSAASPQRLKSSRTAATSASSYPDAPFFRAAKSRTMAASFAVASSSSFCTVGRDGTGTSSSVSWERLERFVEVEVDEEEGESRGSRTRASSLMP
jgi:hypothetical protein